MKVPDFSHYATETLLAILIPWISHEKCSSIKRRRNLVDLTLLIGILFTLRSTLTSGRVLGLNKTKISFTMQV